MAGEKRNNRLRYEEQASRSSHPVHHGSGFEEATASDEERRVKRRSDALAERDEEEKRNDKDNVDDTSPPNFWRESVNAAEDDELSEPATFQYAIGGPDQAYQRKAIRAELESMRLRGVLRAATLPSGHRAIGTKWVFKIKIKRKDDEPTDKCKARLVATDVKQRYGIDYPETFSSVVEYVTLRMVVVGLAKYIGWPLV